MSNQAACFCLSLKTPDRCWCTPTRVQQLEVCVISPLVSFYSPCSTVGPVACLRPATWSVDGSPCLHVQIIRTLLRWSSYNFLCPPHASWTRFSVFSPQLQANQPSQSGFLWIPHIHLLLQPKMFRHFPRVLLCAQIPNFSGMPKHCCWGQLKIETNLDLRVSSQHLLNDYSGPDD